jgi:hypothetical protein
MQRNLVLSGILKYTEDLYPDKDADYVVDKCNLSGMLRKIYFCDKFEHNHLYIKIYSNGKLKFEEDGNLYLKVVKKPVRIGKLCLKDYFVSGEDLEAKLFELVGEDVDIRINGEALFV